MKSVDWSLLIYLFLLKSILIYLILLITEANAHLDLQL